MTNEDRRQMCGQIAAKIARFNSVNSEITGVREKKKLIAT